MAIYYGKTLLAGYSGGTIVKNGNLCCLTNAEYEALPQSMKMLSDVYWCTNNDTSSEIKVPSVDILYRYQSYTDISGDFSWFEIWPDGWTRQGGRGKILDFTTHTYQTASGNTPVSGYIPLNVQMNDTHYTPIITNYMNGSGYDLRSVLSGSLTVGNLSIDGFCVMTDGYLSEYSNGESIVWISEGYRNQDISSVEDYQNVYVDGVSGTWSSGNIGLNGSYSGGGGYGGGVIDGTVLTQSDDLVTSTTISSLTYTVQNDCWVTVRLISGDLTIENSPLYICANNQILGQMFDIYSRTTERPIVGFPIRKGSSISIQRADNANFQSTTMTFRITEYRLNSLAPQIAMPDYSNETDLSENLSDDTEYAFYASDNGWIVFSGLHCNSLSGYIKISGKTVAYVYTNAISYDALMDGCYPVSKGEYVQVKIHHGIQSSITAMLKFYPCKSVASTSYTEISPFSKTKHDVTLNSDNVFITPHDGSLVGSWWYRGTGGWYMHYLQFSFDEGSTWETVYDGWGTDPTDKVYSIHHFDLNIVLPANTYIRYKFNTEVVSPTITGGFYY